MPCDIGVRNVVAVKVSVPLPKNLRIRVKPESLDADLLEKLGEEDNEFLEWLDGLDVGPLLTEALERTLKYLGLPDKIASLTKGGYLEIRGKYANKAEKRKMEEQAEVVGKRFQIETLNVIAQVLGYETKVSVSGDGMVKIEGERESDSGIHKYLAITRCADGSGDIRFEHFASKKELRTEMAKFLALAGKFGVKIAVEDVEEAGKESGVKVSTPETERRTN